jgi:26S proteasome regulatory subunit N7
MDQDLIERNLDKAKTLVDEGGDWDRRNRMKVYQGLRAMSIRDFKSAAELFLDTVATFTSYELMDYQTFVTYTVICSLVALERPKLREKGYFFFISIIIYQRMFWNLILYSSKFLPVSISSID